MCQPIFKQQYVENRESKHYFYWHFFEKLFNNLSNNTKFKRLFTCGFMSFY